MTPAEQEKLVKDSINHYDDATAFRDFISAAFKASKDNGATVELKVVSSILQHFIYSIFSIDSNDFDILESLYIELIDFLCSTTWGPETEAFSNDIAVRMKLIV